MVIYFLFLCDIAFITDCKTILMFSEMGFEIRIDFSNQYDFGNG